MATLPRPKATSSAPIVTGGTIDIAKSGMSRSEITWMRNRLLPLQNRGAIDVEEEFRQACFHITVYKNYASPQVLLQNHRPRPRSPPPMSPPAIRRTNKPSPAPLPYEIHLSPRRLRGTIAGNPHPRTVDANCPRLG